MAEYIVRMGKPMVLDLFDAVHDFLCGGQPICGNALVQLLDNLRYEAVLGGAALTLFIVCSLLGDPHNLYLKDMILLIETTGFIVLTFLFFRNTYRSFLCRPLSFFGRNSIVLLGTHIIIIEFFVAATKNTVGNQYLTSPVFPFFLFAVICMISYLSIRLFTKYIPFLIGKQALISLGHESEATNNLKSDNYTGWVKSASESLSHSHKAKTCSDCRSVVSDLHEPSFRQKIASLFRKVVHYPWVAKFRTELCYRWRLRKCGNKCIIRPLLKWTPACIELGHGVYVEKNCRLEGITRYGNRSYAPAIRIGNGVSFQQNLHMTCASSITIGRATAIGANVTITDIHHPYEDIDTPIEQQPLKVRPVTIGEDCKLYNNAVILPGTTIGANSIVCGDIPDYCVVVGAPARIVKRYDPVTQMWQRPEYHVESRT
ncbi:acyltransferase [Alistipes indistinctus]|uniref:acyltransferase n=1 Tax=Alistipes indistinctus TaxID=626932 RepID=UPI0015FDF433|nr:acyltransferase [Alistipes indistinctus]